MNRRWARLDGAFVLAVVVLSASTGLAADKVFRGSLAQGDRVDGERSTFVDDYEYEAEAGQLLTITMEARGGADLDTYIKISGPGGQTYYNDDDAEIDGSKLVFVVPQGGIWDISATSYDEGEKGDYEVTVRAESLVPVLNERGELTEMSPRLLKEGEYHMIYTVKVEAGKRYAASVISGDFDTFVSVHYPGGLIYNDTGSDGSENAFVIFAPEAGGEAKVVVTSAYPESVGRFRVTVSEVQRAL